MFFCFPIRGSSRSPSLRCEELKHLILLLPRGKKAVYTWPSCLVVPLCASGGDIAPSSSDQLGDLEQSTESKMRCTRSHSFGDTLKFCPYIAGCPFKTHLEKLFSQCEYSETHSIKQAVMDVLIFFLSKSSKTQQIIFN